MSILQERRMTIFSSSGTDAGPSNPNVSPPVDPTNISFSAKRLASEESSTHTKVKKRQLKLTRILRKLRTAPHTLLGSR
ncbi:hypothetical protein PSTT_07336 [Puccinia striiformis]|uniref:Uncharacterized protein n=1 Tax=Puccinia striiformis TaxID=27350 RepID=A0A2S4VGM3_9BASI|nr:hypothetical protein PSTT_07336 [Puccinia striiformis]